jgi:hypothetical protein
LGQFSFTGLLCAYLAVAVKMLCLCIHTVSCLLAVD